MANNKISPVTAKRKPQTNLPRRDFLKLAGAGAAAMALPHPAFAGIFGSDSAPFHFKLPAQNHDLPLSDWGPYSKKHFGVSHISDVTRGLSFDFSIFPLLSLNPGIPQSLPTVTDPCGVHPWLTAPDLSFYSLRIETIWKDQFYCDLSFSKLSETSRLARLEFVNQTATPQQITLNSLSQLTFPPLNESSAEPARLVDVQLPPGGVWVHALDYADLQFAKPRPTDNLVTDAKFRGEARRHDAVEGSVIAQGFGMDKGDTVVYRVSLAKSFTNATLVWRLQMDEGHSAAFQISCAGKNTFTYITIEGKFFTQSTIPIGKLEAGNQEFRFTSLGGAAIALNGFAIVENADVGKLQFVDAPWHPAPQMQAFLNPESRVFFSGLGAQYESLLDGHTLNSLILKYDDVDNYYGLALSMPIAVCRQLKWSGLDAALETQLGTHTKDRIFGIPNRGHAGDPDSLFIHTSSKPLTIAPNSRHIIYGLVCTGTEAEVRRTLAKFDPSSSRNERVYLAAKRNAFQPSANSNGKDLQFGQQLLSAVTLSSLVYPIYMQRSYVRHYSPGRIWDCLYTWDSGFTGLGLLELDLQNAVDILNVYCTPAGAQSAFIHHGSPVPTQIYLFWELWNRTQSRELLEYFYPRLRQYHAFLAGRLGSSTARKHRDHLICTWDFFYNSGGWDDYPPQKYMHAQNLEAVVAPVVNSAHTIRCAKMLRAAAAALGRASDFAEYDDDIATLSNSLQQYSWDEASGYFGYVMHDKDGEPTGILRDGNGVNFDMGMDGIYPLVAGICTTAQEEKILDHLFSPQHLWMDIGITTVDQSAPYYSSTGYWNGSVWLAHQWFFWKTMLDLGRGDLAIRIAQTGLDLWKRVTDATYDCQEHFIPREPYGAGWIQFASLSSPALSWFSALHTPGRFHCGFDTWIESCRFSDDNRKLVAKLKPINGAKRNSSALVCLAAGSNYRVTWNGAPAPFTIMHDGLLQIQLPPQPGELRVA